LFGTGSKSRTEESIIEKLKQIKEIIGRGELRDVQVGIRREVLGSRRV
jgi:hypothetical protein